MIDPIKLQKKTLWYCLASPFTLLPFVVGASALLVQWAFSFLSPVGAVIVLLGFAGAGGGFFTNWLTRRDTIRQKIVAEEERKEKQQRENELDQFARQLLKYADLRPSDYLKDIRALWKSFQEQDFWRKSATDISMVEIIATIDKLFEGCIASLKRSLILYDTASRLDNKAAKKELKDKREELISSVEESITKLGKVLAELSVKEAELSSESDVTLIQRELEAQLASAREIDEIARQCLKTGSFETEGKR